MMTDKEKEREREKEKKLTEKIGRFIFSKTLTC